MVPPGERLALWTLAAVVIVLSLLPAARLGLHSAGGNGVSAVHVDAANRTSDEFMARRGVDARVLAQGAATAHDEIWFPTHAVLLASALATERVQVR